MCSHASWPRCATSGRLCAIALARLPATTPRGSSSRLDSSGAKWPLRITMRAAVCGIAHPRRQLRRVGRRLLRQTKRRVGDRRDVGEAPLFLPHRRESRARQSARPRAARRSRSHAGADAPRPWRKAAVLGQHGVAPFGDSRHATPSLPRPRASRSPSLRARAPARVRRIAPAGRR